MNRFRTAKASVAITGGSIECNCGRRLEVGAIPAHVEPGDPDDHELRCECGREFLLRIALWISSPPRQQRD